MCYLAEVSCWRGCENIEVVVLGLQGFFRCILSRSGYNVPFGGVQDILLDLMLSQMHLECKHRVLWAACVNMVWFGGVVWWGVGCGMTVGQNFMTGWFLEKPLTNQEFHKLPRPSGFGGSCS